MGLRPLPHRADADRRGHPRGVVADVGLRGDDVADQARPDVHGDELSQPGLPGQGRRHRRHHLRRPRPDGHRRRLVRARVEGLRLRVPVGRRPAWPGSTRACRSCATPGATAGSPSTASTTRSTARSSRRNRCRTTVFRCGSPAAARRSRCKIAAKYAQYTNFTSEPEGFAHKSEMLGGPLPRRRHRLRRDRAVGQLQRRRRLVRGRRRTTASSGSGRAG